jgi:hypothetical protein
MTKERDNNQEEEQELAQPYDTTFKDWIRILAQQIYVASDEQMVRWLLIRICKPTSNLGLASVAFSISKRLYV